MLDRLNIILYGRVLGLQSNAISVWQIHAIMHGDGPYNMAIAIMYASPIPTKVLTEGSAKKNGTVPIANATKIIQLRGGEYLTTCHIAQKEIGKAIIVTAIINPFTLRGKFCQSKARHSELVYLIFYRQLSDMLLALSGVGFVG
jgi:hypothetical protein